MNLIDHYHQTIAEGSFVTDPAQLQAIEHLQALCGHLAAPAPTGLMVRLGKALRKSHTAHEQGLYLWGGVGRGKTWLMDMFYDALPFENKLRLHFRHFMQEIHDELTQLRGHKDPLPLVAQHFAQRARVLCLDEFYVEDITDAMILSRLLEALLAQGISLVFTSNLAPEDLYKNGLQRDRFLPAIDLIQKCTHVVNLDGDTDHRLQKLQQTSTYFSPVNAASEQAIAQRFEELAPHPGTADLSLNINHRQISSLRCADDVVWFSFHQLCMGPRASADYIELARQFHTVLISGVPIMGEHEEEWAHRFINMVDEFYDRRVKLLLSAETEPEYLYKGRRHVFDFQRTVSRLIEMRSHDYLALAHRP